MKRIYAVLELSDFSEFDPTSDADLDALGEDLLGIVAGVKAATVYSSASDLIADE